MTKLDISLLIQKAQDLVSDGGMLMAAKAWIPIQTIEDEKGEYEIMLVAERKLPVKDND